MAIPTVVTVQSGPLFDGRADQAVEDFLARAVEDVAAQALADWHRNLDISIQHPTPYYETQLINEMAGPRHRVVHDRGVVYGPWLEGVSPRNQTARFKGYHSLRRARESTEQKIPELLRRLLTMFTARMN